MTRESNFWNDFLKVREFLEGQHRYSLKDPDEYDWADHQQASA